MTFSEQELARYGDLARTGAGSAQRQQQAQSDLLQKKAALDRDRAALAAAKAHTDVLKTQRRQAAATIAAKNAALDQAKINLANTTLAAPADGVVGDRSVRQGQFVQPGTRLMSVVPTGQIYLVANYKETQTGRMVPGQKVAVSIDSFGQAIEARSTVLLPAPALSSRCCRRKCHRHFTKIVQRVPVKILLDPTTP